MIIFNLFQTQASSIKNVMLSIPISFPRGGITSNAHHDVMGEAIEYMFYAVILVVTLNSY